METKVTWQEILDRTSIARILLRHLLDLSNITVESAVNKTTLAQIRKRLRVRRDKNDEIEPFCPDGSTPTRVIKAVEELLNLFSENSASNAA